MALGDELKFKLRTYKELESYIGENLEIVYEGKELYRKLEFSSWFYFTVKEGKQVSALTLNIYLPPLKRFKYRGYSELYNYVGEDLAYKTWDNKEFTSKLLIDKGKLYFKEFPATSALDIETSTPQGARTIYMPPNDSFERLRGKSNNKFKYHSDKELFKFLDKEVEYLDFEAKRLKRGILIKKYISPKEFYIELGGVFASKLPINLEDIRESSLENQKLLPAPYEILK